MIRRLFGILLVAVVLTAAFLYDNHLRSQHPAAPAAPARIAPASPPVVPAAEAGPGVKESQEAPAAAQSADQGTHQTSSATPTQESGRPVAGPAGESGKPGQEAHAPGVEPEVVDGRLMARLANGLTVVILEDKRFPLVAERLYVRAGSAYEAKGQEGLSHLLEHMVFNSTAKREKGRVAGDIEGVGGDVNAATSFDYTQYMADLPSAHWRLGLDAFQDMIFGAKFDPEELSQEKKVVISELERGLDNPGQRLFLMSQSMAWSGLPYSHPIIGYRETVQAATSDDLRAYVKRLYQPQSMLLVVVGDVDARAVWREAQAVFGGLVGDRPVIPPDVSDLPASTTGPLVKAASGNWNKCYLRLNFAVPGMHSAKDVPLEFLAELLGGGRTSRLYRHLIYEKQLADDLDVAALTLERGGMLRVEASLDRDKVEPFWNALVKELAKVKASDFTDDEIARTRLNEEDGLYRARETLAGLANKLAYYQFFGFGQDGEANAIYDVRHVDRPQLQGLIDGYLTPGNASLALLAPGSDQGQADALAGRLMEDLKREWPAKPGSQSVAEKVGSVQAPEVVDLGGGRTVVLLHDPTMPYAAVTLAYRGGDGLLQPDRQGLAELAAKSLTRSTDKRGAVEIQDFLDGRAASLSASTGRDTFSLSARFPARFASDVTELFSEVVQEPAFAPAEVDRARKTQLAQIAETTDSPTGLAFRNLFPFLFTGSHYGYFRSGQPEAVKAYTPEELRAFWEKQRTMPWVLSVCGVFDRKAVLDLAAKLAVEPVGQAPDIPDPAWSVKREMGLKLPERNQSHLFWIFPVPGKRSSDTAALEILNSALAGQSGLLFSELRDKQGLGYTVTSFLWQAPKTGFLAFYIGTTTDKEAQALEGFRKIAGALAEKGLDEEELVRAVNTLEGDYYQGRQSLGSRSSEAAGNLIMGFTLDFDRELLASEHALTGEQVTAVAKKYLDPSKAYLLKIEP